MTVTPQIYGQPQYYALSSSREQKRKSKPPQGGFIVPVLKAALFGGLSQVILLAVGLTPLPDQVPIIITALWIIPAFVLTCLSTGLVATVFAGDDVVHTQKAGEVAWMAGFWAGVLTAIMAMVLAANGLLLVEFGQSIVNLRTPEQLELLNSIISVHTLALSGRVLGALLLFGLIGSLMSALMSAFGGMAYFKTTFNNTINRSISI